MLGSAIINSFQEKNIEFLAPGRRELDLYDIDAVTDFFKRRDIKTVVHCAALVGGIRYNELHPADFLLNNLRLDANLLSAARDSGVSELFYMSSSCTYPLGTQEPFNEINLKFGEFENTNKSYAVAKMSAVQTIKAINNQNNLSYRILVLSNLYGPGDKFAPEKSHLLAAAIKKCDDAKENGASEVTIWGSGKPRREFTFVQDVAEWVCNHLNEVARLPEILNLGSGLNLSIHEYYESVASIVGFNGHFIFDPKMPDGTMSKLMNSSLARVKFAWDPKTSLNLGLKKTYDWFLRRKGLEL